jgi:hypothetical protein
LAVALEDAYAEINAELTALLSAAEDSRTSHTVSTGEWSIKQVIAHLIHSERGIHDWIASMIGSQERWQDEWEGNIPARVKAAVVAYQSVQTLLQELTQVEAESVALLAALPAELVARRRSYRRVAQQILGWPDHTREHVAQIRSMVQS